MIVLTDGLPSHHDLDPQVALALAKKYSIKIYTIGLGSRQGGYYKDPNYGIVAVQTPLNAALLAWFAQETGGQFFEASNAHDVERIYETIDRLEKASYEPPVHTTAHEYVVPLVLAALLAILVELCISFAWRFL